MFLAHAKQLFYSTLSRKQVTVTSIVPVDYQSWVYTMALRVLTTAPKSEDFTPLQEHQEQTPSTFFDSKPVLYAHYSGLTLSAPASQLQSELVFSKFTSETEGDDALVKDVSVWVNSE